MPAKNGRNVSLAAEHEALVQRLIKNGRYNTASEVVREGLRLLEREEHKRLLAKWVAEGLTAKERRSLPAGALDAARQTLNARIQEGLDSLARGEAIDGEAFFARWLARIDAAAKPKRRRSA